MVSGRNKTRGVLGAASSAQDVSARIVSVARRRFLEEGFRRVSMDELARDLAMSKKTLYANFKDKHELVHAVILSKLESVESELSAISTAAGAVEFPQLLTDLITCLQRHTSEISIAFVRDIERSMPELFVFIETRRRIFLQSTFGRVLERGKELGKIRTDLDTNILIGILLGTVDAIITPRSLQALGIGPSEGMEAVTTVFFHGVLKSKEPKDLVEKAIR